MFGKTDFFAMTAAQLKIGIAVKSELSAILELQKECYQSEAALYNDYNIQPLRQTLDEVFNDFDNGVTYLAGYIDGILVASVRGNINKNTGYINKLIVSPGFQNRGYGKLMMKAIEQVLESAVRFELFTGHKSEKNIRLYEKLGYKVYNTVAVHDGLSLIYFEKIIRGSGSL